MIVRAIEGMHAIVRQPEHARQSAVIAAHLDPAFLPPPQEQREFLLAVRDHDDGWAEWETNPHTAPSGLPLDFPDIDKRDHAENWRRTIYGALFRHGPAAAAWIARHADELMESDNRDTVDALAARAWPGLNAADRAARVSRGFRALRFADALSLMALDGWSKRLAFDLDDAGGNAVPHEAWRDGPWSIRVWPWPFVLPRLTRIHADGVCVSSGSEGYALALLKTPREAAMRIQVEILPGGPSA